MFNIRHLEQSIDTFMQAEHIPGLALALVQGQEVVYARGFGATSVEDGTLPVTPETLFGIGSTTKPLTGTAILRLVERGAVDLDIPVKHSVPELRLSDPKATEQVTLRMLLSHTAGLPTRYRPFGRRDPEALEGWVRHELPHLPLVAPPGKVHSYSNPGLILAGYVAQVVSGKAFAALMSEEVFGPLNMQRTTFDPLVALTYPMALAHRRPDGKTLQVWHRFFENSGHAPSGYALSTVLDLANFAMMQMHDGVFRGKQVLSPHSVQMMQTPHVDLSTLTEMAYGLTLRSEWYKGMRLVSHDGDITSFQSRFAMLPEVHVAVSILVNWPAPLRKLSDALLDSVVSVPKRTPPPQEPVPEQSSWGNVRGWYLGEFGLAKILLNKDRLTLELNGEVMLLKASGKARYIGQDESGEPHLAVSFLGTESGPAEYLMIDTWCYKRIAEARLSLPDPVLWQAYVGSYAAAWEASAGTSTETWEMWTVRIEEGNLLIKSEFYGGEMTCRPLDRTCFTCPAGLIEFREVQEGKASLLIQRIGNVFTRVQPSTTEP